MEKLSRELLINVALQILDNIDDNIMEAYKPVKRHHINEMALAPKMSAIEKCEKIQSDPFNAGYKITISPSNRPGYMYYIGFTPDRQSIYTRKSKNEIADHIRSLVGTGYPESRGYDVFGWHFKDGAGTNSEEFLRNREEAEAEAKRTKFETAVTAADTSKYMPTERDWAKMLDYMNKKSNPERLAMSCKDANKVISRFIIAKLVGWDAAAREFARRGEELGYATKAELEAYSRKYLAQGIPDMYKEYLDDMAVNDLKGGIAMIKNNQSTGSLSPNIVKALDSNPYIESYEVTRDGVTNEIKITKEDGDSLTIYVRQSRPTTYHGQKVIGYVSDTKRAVTYGFGGYCSDIDEMISRINSYIGH